MSHENLFLSSLYFLEEKNIFERERQRDRERQRHREREREREKEM